MPANNAPTAQNGSLEALCVNTIVMLHTDTTVTNGLTLEEQFRQHARRVSAGGPTAQADFKNFLMSPPVNLPSNVADNISGLQGKALFDYVGQYVCQYFW